MRDVIVSFNGMAKRLEEASEQRRRWLADLGHELRNPLTVIQGELEAMVDGVHPPTSDQLNMLLDETAVMARLLDDLRTLSLSESGELKLNREPVELSQLVEDAVAPFREEARRADRKLVVDVAPGSLDVDPLRLREVIANLVANALRHSRNRVEVSAVRMSNEWQIAVFNDGPAIPDELLSRVFERFAKGSDSKGTGLGLSIAHDLIAAHGGTIAAQNVAGGGTRFTVALPD
jgi:two-component system sensor histidine kinase BaeS